VKCNEHTYLKWESTHSNIQSCPCKENRELPAKTSRDKAKLVMTTMLVANSIYKFTKIVSETFDNMLAPVFPKLVSNIFI